MKLWPTSALDVAKDWRAALWVGLCWLFRDDHRAAFDGGDDE